jgi:hypothetical protein
LATAGRAVQNFNARNKDFLFYSSSHHANTVEMAIKAQRDFVSTSRAKENERRACNHDAAIFFLIALVPLQ